MRHDELSGGRRYAGPGTAISPIVRGRRSTAAPAGNAGVSAPEGCLPPVQLSKHRLRWREEPPFQRLSGPQLVRSGNQKSRDSLVG